MEQYEKETNATTKKSSTTHASRLKPVHISIQDKNKSRHSITIRQSPEEVYAFWRNFSNLAHFMKDVSQIKVTSFTKSHWVVELKSGLKAEWDAQITEEQNGRMISWASLEGSDVETSGTVWFDNGPSDFGTIVRLSMDYKIPGGKLAEIATSLVGESPDLLIATNLKRLKALLETGEIPTTEGQPSGREELKLATH